MLLTYKGEERVIDSGNCRGSWIKQVVRLEANIRLVALPFFVPFPSHHSAVLFRSGWGTVDFCSVCLFSWHWASSWFSFLPCIYLFLVDYFLSVLFFMVRITLRLNLHMSLGSFACADTSETSLPCYLDPWRVNRLCIDSGDPKVLKICILHLCTLLEQLSILDFTASFFDNLTLYIVCYSICLFNDVGTGSKTQKL